MYLDRAKLAFQKHGLDVYGEPKPCTEEEVQVLEQWLGFAVPQAYREFLLWMGHGGGKVLVGSDCYYSDLLDIQEGAVELLAENRFRFSEQLPEDAFVIWMHQGYQFYFVRISEGDDPPVYFYGEWTEHTTFIREYDHYSEYLLQEIEGYGQFMIEHPTIADEWRVRR